MRYIQVSENNELYGPLKRVHAEGHAVQIKLTTGGTFTAYPDIKKDTPVELKAFIATIEIQTAVLAETEEEAQQLAYDNLRDEVSCPDDFHVQPMTFCPDGWDDRSILYSHNNDEEITVKEVLDKLKKEENND